MPSDSSARVCRKDVKQSCPDYSVAHDFFFVGSATAHAAVKADLVFLATVACKCYKRGMSSSSSMDASYKFH